MPEPDSALPDSGVPGGGKPGNPRDRDRDRDRAGQPGQPGSPGRTVGSGGEPSCDAGLADMPGVLDLTCLQGVLDLVRESDEAAGDPTGEDGAAYALLEDGEAWTLAELAGTAAEDMTPGAGLAYWASGFAPAQMTDYALPGAAAACRRLASWAQATELALVAEVAARAAARDSGIPAGPGGLPAQVPEEAAAEVALALRMSQYGASCWTDLAITLAGRLTGTAAALRDGVIDLTRARLIAEATSVLDDRAAKLAEEKVLPGAGGKTPAQLRAALRRAVISVDPDAAERRREAAERRAKVGLYGDEEGTATLSGQNLPGAHAAAAMARISALARAMKTSGASGGIDLLRAQVYIGLLLGTLPLIPPAEDAPPDPPSEGPPSGPGPSGPWGPGHPVDPDDPSGAGAANDPSNRESTEDLPDPRGPRGPRDPRRPHDPDAGAPGSPGRPAEPGNAGDPGDRGTEDPRGSGDPGPGGIGDPGNGDPNHPAGLDDPDDPLGAEDLSDARDLRRSGPGESAGPDQPDGPNDADDPSCPDRAAGLRSRCDPGPGGPDPPGDPGDTADTNDVGDPNDANDLYDAGNPSGTGDPGDLGAPDEPWGQGALSGPGYPGGRGGETAGRPRPWVPRWPGLPLPGHVPAGLAASGTGALAGLPRDPASSSLLDLTVPWRTLAGLIAEPALLTRLGPVTPQTARRLAEAAATDQGTEWRVIVTDSRGRAIAVTRVLRARSRCDGAEEPAGLIGRVTLTVPVNLALGGSALQGAPALSTAGLGTFPAAESGPGAGPKSSAAGRAVRPDRLGEILALALQAARRAAAIAGAEIAEAANLGIGRCAHRKSSLAYRPPPRLREFVAARDQTCRYPVCRQPASRADQDHTIPHDQGGRTCDCNLGGACRTHHRIKQRPGWRLAQREPGTFVWSTPAGRTYTQTPDTYAS